MVQKGSITVRKNQSGISYSIQYRDERGKQRCATIRNSLADAERELASRISYVEQIKSSPVMAVNTTSLYGPRRKQLPSQERLHELFYYRADGVFVRRCKTTGRKTFVGQVVGNKARQYDSVGVDSSNYMLHRLVWVWFNGSIEGGVVDHINANPCDSRIENLQNISFAENSQRRFAGAA